MHDPEQGASAHGWTVAYWMLTAAFILTAALNLLHVRAGFLTNYLSDLSLPAWLYILSRGLVPGQSSSFAWRWMPWIGRTPESAATFFFLASSATEVSQIIWPKGFFAGRFDPWDIAAYGAGLLACYLCDKSQGTGRRQSEGVS
jgi:hypothetical protein